MKDGKRPVEAIGGRRMNVRDVRRRQAVDDLLAAIFDPKYRYGDDLAKRRVGKAQ